MLKKILYKECPHCGSLSILEKRTNGNMHTSDFSELMEFECGLKLSCEVNCEETKTIDMCMNSKDYKNRNEKRISALKILFEFIRSIDVDDDFKRTIISSIDNILIR